MNEQCEGSAAQPLVALPVGMLVHYFNPVVKRCQAAIISDRDPATGRYSVCVLVPPEKQAPLAWYMEPAPEGWMSVQNVPAEEIELQEGQPSATLGAIHALHA